MADNFNDKGYTHIRLRDADNGVHLCEMNIFKEAGESDFYVDYENGTIYIDWNDGSPKDVIGYYEPVVNGTTLAQVFDSTKRRVIGRVGDELIYFRAKEADPSVGRYTPEEECLAYYTKNGSITTLQALPRMGLFNGSEIGGAAAFVAVFFAFNFKSVYRDYFEMDKDTFNEKNVAYLNPLGL